MSDPNPTSSPKTSHPHPPPAPPRTPSFLSRFKAAKPPHTMTAPSIACLGVIGRNNNPLHIAIFPSYNPLPPDGQTLYAPLRTPLQYSLLLSSSLDIFASRSNPIQTAKSTSQTPAAQRDSVKLTGDYGLLSVVDERLNIYGFETNTGVKFVCVIDSRGRRIDVPGDGARSPSNIAAVKEGDIKIVFKAMQNAYIKLLQNPFYEPDVHSPTTGKGGKKISSRRFEEEIQRIGEGWSPGMTSL